jgi:maleate isomerase
LSIARTGCIGRDDRLRGLAAASPDGHGRVAILEYAPRGLFGVLTPQASTTVEAAFAILCPPGYGMLTGRLTSDKPTIDARLVDRVASMDRSLDQFANAPVGAVAFACTGAGYLVDPEEEADRLAAIRARCG